MVLIDIHLTAKFKSLFVGDHFKDEVTAQVQNVIRKTIEENKGTLGREKIASKLNKLFPSLIKQKGYFKTVSTEVLNSGRSYSNLRFYQDAEILRFEVIAVLDKATSEVCRFMNGNILSVSKALDRYDLFDQATSKEEVKEIVPWLKEKKDGIFRGNKLLNTDMSGEELQALGINAPPYHGRCRTTVTPVF